MIKIYCLEFKEEKNSLFSIAMSEKYTDVNAKKMSNFAWYSLEHILFNEYGVKVCKDMIVFNEYGKPYLKNNEIYFNISHCKHFVLLGISDSEIGVDIESKIPIERSNNLIKKFSETTIKEYNICFDKTDYFSKRWVVLEAYSKFLGTGLKINSIKNIELDYSESLFSFYDSKTDLIFYCAAINKNNEKIDLLYKSL